MTDFESKATGLKIKIKIKMPNNEYKVIIRITNYKQTSQIMNIN